MIVINLIQRIGKVEVEEHNANGSIYDARTKIEQWQQETLFARIRFELGMMARVLTV